jgi:uncharacterized protein (DUF2126 family)
MSSPESFDDAVRRHDAAVAGRGLAIWVGSEPTFTDRFAQSPEWISGALGGEKEARARRLLRALAERLPGGVVLRSVGRRYPGENAPRWNYGLYRRRDGAALWRGPPDPLLRDESPAWSADLDGWATALAAALAGEGWRVEPRAADDGTRQLDVRFAEDASSPSTFVLAATADDEVARLELPAIDDVARWMDVIRCVADAANACGLPALVIAGELPPVDATVELTTITPDPAVIEINSAPSANAADFLRRSREMYAAAAAQGLAPYRLYFNGAVADSGGGGQITLGGPAPQSSPFFLQPRLLPRLVRYFNRHPALSYLYSHDFVGSTGQSARADERGSIAFDELALALELLDRHPAPTPGLLWQSLAPFLCDAAGNSHRAEINIEKFANPFLPGRGQQGLVEFRALRMQHTPERATALACLLRAVVAMLAGASRPLPLLDWGRKLHQRFALPFYLEQDLEQVLDDLRNDGLGLGEAIEAVLRHDEFRLWAQVDLPGAVLEIRRALEFWPLLGDAASPEQGGTSRLVDASTTRIEVRLRPADSGDGDWRRWRLFAAGVALPWREERDERGELRVYGLRYRSFAPAWGLHPSLGPQAPLQLLLCHPARPAQVVTLHEWRPDNEAYPGLPVDLDEAGRRRAERVTVCEAPPSEAPAGPAAGDVAPPGVGAYCVDLRYFA